MSTTTESVVYLYTDHLMTNRLATNNNGIITWRWESEAFGNTPAQELSGVSVNLRFPGQYYDSETNLHYNWHRYYYPTLGRYITSDLIGLSAGLNTYNYVGANPIVMFDSKGLTTASQYTYGAVRQRAINSMSDFSPPSGTVGLRGNTIYFYKDPLKGWCNRHDYINGCKCMP